MISQSSIDALRARADIVDVVGSYLELKKAGQNYKAPCPFHDEKTGSFTVSERKGIYHCFGCGAHGDAIKFVQEYRRIPFNEAVEQLAADLNFTLSYEGSSEPRTDYTRIMESVNRFYLSSRNADIAAYLMGRGVTMESIETFEIGYAPPSTFTMEHLRAQSILTPDAIACGIVAADEGRTYARLTERVTFPIRNQSGKLIGFGGRILSGDRAKYINSPQTALFDKSRQLYGFNIARNAIHDRGTITITEGYLDVVMFHQAGIHTAVATMGTALTEEHAKLIKKNGWRALLCYDGDRAGIAAALKASRLLSHHGVFGGVVIFPEGKDPADMVRDGDIDSLMHLLKRPRPLIRFVIDQIAASHNLALPQGKQAALEETTAFMAPLPPVIQDEYREIIANVIGIDPRHVHAKPQEPTPSARLPRINTAEMNIIATARENDMAFNYLMDFGVPECFTHHRAEYDMLLRGDETLDGILLHDDITIYTAEDFMMQLRILMIDHHKKMILKAINTPGRYEEKKAHIDKINAKIIQLQKALRGVA